MSIFWLVLAVAAIVAEMLTGTLYLLVIGVAAAVAAALAWGDQSLVVQCVAASVVGVAGSLLVRRWRPDASTRMPDILEGAAEVISVVAPGRLRVRWRGTEWDGVSEVQDLAAGDAVRIEALSGNQVRVVRA